MCGGYALAESPSKLAKQFDVLGTPDPSFDAFHGVFIMMRFASTTLAALAIGSICCPGIEDAALRNDEPRKTELAKEVAEWNYPKATQVGSAETEGNLYQSIMMTKDALDDVLKFYEKKSGQHLTLKKEETKTSIYLSGIEVQDGQSVATILTDDSGQPPDPRKQGAPPRGVIIRMLTQNRSKYLVSVMISHTDGEKETHVAITYFKK
jgi:hypothetical protein